MGITNPQVFKAIEDIYPKRGCSKSHLGVYELSKRSESEAIFVCEDDIRFVCSARTLELILMDFLNQVDHEVLCLGNVTRSRSKTLSRYLDSTHDVQTTSCYIFKKAIRNKLIESANYSIHTLAESKGVEIAIDKSWKKLQTGKRFVVPKKKICMQYRGYSDIERRNVNYLN